MAKAGAGKIGEYSACSFSIAGGSRFTPSENANPHIGERGKPEIVEEDRIEFVCDRKIAKNVVIAMKGAHPYEEVAFDVYPLIDFEDL